MNLRTSLSTLRSCVTNGESWVFFIFDAADSGEGGTVSILEEFCLGDDDDDLSGLSLVLGLLSDWVRAKAFFNPQFESLPFRLSIQILNSKEKEQRFFTYFNL